MLCFAPCKIGHNTELPTGCVVHRIMCVHDGEIEHLLWIESRKFIYIYIGMGG